MGYYTRYELSFRGVEYPYDLAIMEELKQISGYSDFGSPIKWYDHEDDMREISRRYPNVVFTLDGDGEEQGDEWRMYFKNGFFVKHVRSEWVPPVFDESNLHD